MGCGSSKYSSAGETKGTTLVGLWYKGGILVGADSRSTSNEKKLAIGKPLRIDNDFQKMFEISPYIIAVMSGTAIDCKRMCSKVKSEFEKNNSESVDYALGLMCAHLRGLPDKIKKDKAFGVLMAGWDKQSGLRLYQIFIRDGRVTNKKIDSGCTTLGSGSTYARSILKYRYEFDVMDGDRVAEVALEALFNSTFFDKSTGGTLRRYKIEEGKPFITMDEVDPFDVPNPVVRSNLDSEYHTLRDYEPRILFVVYSTTFPIRRTKELVNHFKSQYGGRDAVEAIAAHLVVQKKDFYFHRVVFKSEEDASTVWNNVKKNSQVSHDDTFNLLQHFPYRSQLVFSKEESDATGVTDMPVYVNKSSEHLLQSIHYSN